MGTAIVQDPCVFISSCILSYHDASLYGVISAFICIISLTICGSPASSILGQLQFISYPGFAVSV